MQMFDTINPTPDAALTANVSDMAHRVAVAAKRVLDVLQRIMYPMPALLRCTAQTARATIPLILGRASHGKTKRKL